MFSFLAFILLLTTFILGFQLTNFLGRYKLPPLLLVGAAFPVGMVFISITTLIFNPFIGCTVKNGVIQIFISTLIASRLFFVSPRLMGNLKFATTAPIFVVVLLAGIMAYSYKIAFLRTKENEWFGTAENDMWLEVATAMSFYQGVNHYSSPFNLKRLMKLQFGVINPIMLNNTLYSEYLPAVYEALLLNAKIPLNMIIFILTTLLTLSIFLIIYAYSYKVFNSRISAMLAVPCVFFLGGYGIVNALDNNSRLSPYTDYRFCAGYGIYLPWGHEILHCLLTSRLCLLCLAISALAYVFLEHSLDCSAGIFAWTVVFMRPPSAAILFFVYLFYKREKIFVRAFFTSIAAGFLYLLKLRPKFGQMYEENWPTQPLIGFFWHIFGIVPIGVVFGYLFTKKFAPLASIAAIITFLFISLQTAHRFNFFAMITALYPIFAVFATGGFMSFTFISKKKSKQGSIGMLMFMITCTVCISTAVGYIHRIDQAFEAYPEDTAREVGIWFIKNTPMNSSVFTIGDREWPPATFFAGRQEMVSTDQAMQAVYFEQIDQIKLINVWLSSSQGKAWNHTDYIVVHDGAQYSEIIKNHASKNMKLLFSNEEYSIFGH